MKIRSTFSKSFAALWIAFTGAIVLEAGLALPVRANSTLEPEPTRLQSRSVSVEFHAPGDAAPVSSLGGGMRGSIQFAAPGSAAPRSSVSGGVRGEVQFAPPESAAPRSSVSGGVRGDVEFETAENDAPNNHLDERVPSDFEFETSEDATPSFESPSRSH